MALDQWELNKIKYWIWCEIIQPSPPQFVQIQGQRANAQLA